MALRKITRALSLTAAAICLGTVAAQAQDTLPTRGTLLPTKNTKEISLAGQLQFNNGSPYALQLGYGIFTTPAVEVGAVGTVAGASHTSTAYSVGAFADYYFRGNEAIESENALLPYLGVFAGIADNGGGNSNLTSLGAQGGVKYFFNPNVALDAEVRYRSVNHGGGDNTDLILGLSTFFR